VIGLYGVGGMGKTQICKIMCNEMDGEFDGKVCHVELGKQSKHELVKKVLSTLTNTSAEVVQEVGQDKVFVLYSHEHFHESNVRPMSFMH
jgi:Holliday junction resolvasome RuvABC ATP-dependent DNA helicase subunit